MYFVPEGQHDSSLARSAWSHEENSLVPAGRLNGSRLSRNSTKTCFSSEMPENNPAMANTFALSPGTDNDFDRPSGTGSLCIATRHFVPGYAQPVPPGQKPFTHRSASHQVSAYGVCPGNAFYSPGCSTSDLLSQKRHRDRRYPCHHRRRV
jgi:hypothetical protein